MITPGLIWSDLGCLRGGRILFEGLAMALGPGDGLMIGGPNGVGKSSLLRILGGLLPPSAGKVTAAGPLAFAGEAMALDPRLPLARALAYWAALDGRDAGDIAGALAAMGLGTLADVPVRFLSTGQRKRAALARVIAGGQPIWLLDEPGNGLDGEALGLLATAMAGRRAAGGIVVVATHQPLDLPDARDLTLA